MKTKIVRKKGGVKIQVSEIESNTDELMSAFQECQEGKCSCPTNEYEKVESLSIEQSKEGISLSVKAKDGEKIDIAEIEKCLEYTKKRTGY
ncbi:MAG: hypothetical protein ABW086_02730 [Sedimenticola sp.]